MGKTFLLFVCAISLVFCITSYSYADLIDNGDGTITQTRKNGTKLMWTQNTLLAGDISLPGGEKTWNEAKLWAANLDFASYSDWRLPRTPGTTINGFTAEGELGDLYHSELKTLASSGPFKMSDVYNNTFWTETELDVSSAFIVTFGQFKKVYSNSYQHPSSKEDNYQAWAVRDVIDSVPAAEIAEDTADAEVTEAAEDVEVTEATEDVEVTEATEDVEVTTDAEVTADAEATEVTAEAEVTADTGATADAEDTAATEATADAEVTADTEVAETTEPQGVQEYTRAKGETEGDRIVLHILDENNIEIFDNGNCIKVFWEEQLRKNAEITLCLYGINDYRWEDKRFWISFNKGISIKCNEVVIDIPLNVISQGQIQTIFKIKNDR